MTTRADNLQLDDQLCFALYAATNAVTRAYRPLLASIGLTYPQYLVMLVLWQGDGRPVSDIAARLSLPPHGVSPLVGRLQAAGLVRRRQDGSDRRIVRVHLTAAGRDLEEAASAVQRSVACATGLTPGQLAALRGELQDLVRLMDARCAPQPDAGCSRPPPNRADHPPTAIESPARITQGAEP